MGLAGLQNAIARICTEPETRQRWMQDPSQMAIECGLTEEESRELIAQYTNELEPFADALLSKRTHEALRSLPLTCQELGKDIRAFFRDYAATHPPLENNNPMQEALAFARWLDTQKPGLPLPARHFLKWEQAGLEMRVSTRKWMLRLLYRPISNTRRRFSRLPHLVLWRRTNSGISLFSI